MTGTGQEPQAHVLKLSVREGPWALRNAEAGPENQSSSPAEDGTGYEGQVPEEAARAVGGQRGACSLSRGVGKMQNKTTWTTVSPPADTGGLTIPDLEQQPLHRCTGNGERDGELETHAGCWLQPDDRSQTGGEGSHAPSAGGGANQPATCARG